METGTFDEYEGDETGREEDTAFEFELSLELVTLSGELGHELRGEIGGVGGMW